MAQPAVAVATLRERKQPRVLKLDFKSSPYCARWEVMRSQVSGQEPQLLQELRKACRDNATATTALVAGAASGSVRENETARAQPIAIGLRSVMRAVERGEAEVVLLCTDGVASVLVQHVPVMCTLRGVPVAILAASPKALASAIAPITFSSSPGKRYRSAVAIALLRVGCAGLPKLSTFCQHMRRIAPTVNIPFLIPAAGVPRQVKVQRLKGPELQSPDCAAPPRLATVSELPATAPAPVTETSASGAAASVSLSSGAAAAIASSPESAQEFPATTAASAPVTMAAAATSESAPAATALHQSPLLQHKSGKWQLKKRKRQDASSASEAVTAQMDSAIQEVIAENNGSMRNLACHAHSGIGAAGVRAAAFGDSVSQHSGRAAAETRGQSSDMYDFFESVP